MSPYNYSLNSYQPPFAFIHPSYRLPSTVADKYAAEILMPVIHESGRTDIMVWPTYVATYLSFSGRNECSWIDSQLINMLSIASQVRVAIAIVLAGIHL